MVLLYEYMKYICSLIICWLLEALELLLFFNILNSKLIVVVSGENIMDRTCPSYTSFSNWLFAKILHVNWISVCRLYKVLCKLICRLGIVCPFFFLKAQILRVGNFMSKCQWYGIASRMCSYLILDLHWKLFKMEVQHGIDFCNCSSVFWVIQQLKSILDARKLKVVLCFAMSGLWPSVCT